MKKLFSFLVATALVMPSFATKVSCSYTTVSANITAGTTWSSGTLYNLAACVHVTSGNTLTIPAGTHIIGDAGASLIVDAGAKLIANGTSLNPIVFTSSEIPGDRAPGDWGGLVLLGRARTNTSGGTITLSDRSCSLTAGDTTDTDSSGSLQFIRVEYAENGMTAIGVGSRTVLNHLQSSYSENEAFRFAGGKPNARNLVAFNFKTTGLLLDYGVHGNFQDILTVQKDLSLHDASGTNAMVISNNSSVSGTATNPQISNATLYGIRYCGNTTVDNDFVAGMLFRDGAKAIVRNSIITGFPEGIRMEGNTTLQNADNGDILFDYNSFYDNVSPAVTPSTWPTGGCASSISGWVDGSDALCAPQNNQVPVSSLEYSASICANYCESNIPEFLLGDNDLSSTDYTGMADFFVSSAYRGAFDQTTDWTEDWTAFCPQNENYCLGQKQAGTTNIMEQQANGASLQLSPNPATGITHVLFTSSQSGKVTVSVISNITGQTLRAYSHIVQQGNQKIALDIKELSTGLYVIKVAQPDGTATYSRLLVK